MLRRHAALQCSILRLSELKQSLRLLFPPPPPSVSLMYMFHLLGLFAPSLRLSDDAAVSPFFALRLLDSHVAHLFRALIAPGCRNLISRQIPAQREKGMTTYIFTV